MLVSRSITTRSSLPAATSAGRELLAMRSDARSLALAAMCSANVAPTTDATSVEAATTRAVRPSFMARHGLTRVLPGTRRRYSTTFTSIARHGGLTSGAATSIWSPGRCHLTIRPAPPL